MSKPKKKIAPKKPVKKPSKKKAPVTPAAGLRKFTRGPLFWIVLGILAVTFFGQISSAANRSPLAAATTPASRKVSAKSNYLINS